MATFLPILSLTLMAGPTWSVREMGSGGESFVSTDGAGAVYVSSHLPTQLIASRDYGMTFGNPTVFEDSLGDMVSLAMPEGRVLVTYMNREVNGLIARTSRDFGATFTKGAAPFDRPLDREWPAYDAFRKQVVMTYSDGYIGGPKSKGTYLSVSADDGQTWKETARTDNEPEGHYAVDPHVTTSTDGKIYAFWNTSTDYDKVDSYRFSRSLDGGKTFDGHVTLQTLPPSSGDTQERWMLGGLAAFGSNTVSAFYVAYSKLTVNEATTNSLQVFVRTSTDGGKTFGPAVAALGASERLAAAKELQGKLLPKGPLPYPIEVEVWGAYDSTGILHLVYFDNRGGHRLVNGNPLPVWQLRHLQFDPKTGKSSPSKPVSEPFAAARPAMDFISCCTDAKNLYVTWTENRDSANAWDFTGKLMFAHRSLK